MSDEEPNTVDTQQAITDEQAAPVTESEKEQRGAVDEFNKTTSKGELSMHVKVGSPFRDYYDGPAFSITAENATGPFDILPKHHNFISLLSPCELIIRTSDKGDQKIKISGGIMHVKTDKVIVFLDV